MKEKFELNYEVMSLLSVIENDLSDLDTFTIWKISEDIGRLSF